ncbi:MAG: methionine--tRNA ligase [Oligoflexia bacterium]|nr:methionine--tRNA ligase [Oligoflexia bacterium]
MSNSPFKSYITTPLYYVNARPHLGHSYTTIMADVVKRHREQRGVKTLFLTGTDEHGEKIEQMAKAQNRDTRSFVDEVSQDFRATWEKMGIEFDIFYRTTDPKHVRAVQHALQTLKDREEIVFREYEGKYCVGCERFLTDSELNADGLCPDHLKKPEPRKEANYFFLMSRYQKPLIEYLEKNPNSVRPDHFRQEMLSFLKQPLGDLCISRPKQRLTWGIELPFDSNFVTYVWFDALLNYLVAMGWPEAGWNQELWQTVNHLIAKDILKAHAVYWPTMLMALGVSPARELQVSGYWLVDGTKMSKSLGNVIRPLEVEAQYGKDTLRFYLLREMSYGLDATFTLEGYINCINSQLANGIGNLVSRVYTIAKKNLGTVAFSNDELLEADHKVLALRARAREAWDAGFAELKYQNSLKAWSELVTACDLYVNEMKPWALAKDPNATQRLHVVMGVCLRMIQALAALIAPVLPHAAQEIGKALGLGERAFDPIEAGFEDRVRFELPTETPKLFMRVQMPAPESRSEA